MTKEELRQKVQGHNQLTHEDAVWLLNRIEELEAELANIAPVKTELEIKVESLLDKIKAFIKNLLRL